MSRTSIQRLALLLTASFATLLVALALTSASASASRFCGGLTVNNHAACYGAARMVLENILAYGESTGVCVGYNEVIYAACSPNGRAYEQATAWLTGYVSPLVIGQAGNTVVWGIVS